METYQDGYLLIDAKQKLLRVSGIKTILTQKEWRVLSILLDAVNEPVSVIALQMQALEIDSGGASMIRELIASLRRQIEKDFRQPEYIKRVRGAGYMFQTQN